MRRRHFIAVMVATVVATPTVRPYPASAQAERLRRIDVLMGFSESDPVIPGFLAAFAEELTRLGWIEGRNAVIEQHWTNADLKRAGTMAKELVASSPDVILCSSTPVTAALHRETSTIPIVFTIVGDPVAAGFVAGLPRPGGNITGFAQTEPATGGKWLDLIKEIAPTIKRAGIIFNPDTPPSGADDVLNSFRAAGRALGIEAVDLPVRNDPEIEAAIAGLGVEPAGLVVMPDSFTNVHIGAIISSTTRHKIPAIFQAAQLPRGGGLISYGPDVTDIFRRAAGYVDRILRGEKPADLAVQWPAKYLTIINLKTAKALGLTVPPSLLAAADEVIE